MAQVRDKSELDTLFASIYERPTVERMQSEVSDIEFEHFVGYVFRQAGYGVEHTGTKFGQGLDLRLYHGPVASGTVHGGVSVKHYSGDGLVTGPQVMIFRGALKSALPGYVVTTTGFNKPAFDEAEKSVRIWPLDGPHFVRYIDYVRGSRAIVTDRLNDATSLPMDSMAPISPDALFAADAIQRRPVRQTRVLVLANNKGGVGKTTTALNLAFGLAALDQQVLLVDMDPQANLTKELPSQAPHAVPMHLGQYFTGQRKLSDLVRQTQFPRVWLIPSDNDLTLSDTGLAAGPAAELRFVRDLHASDIVPPPGSDSRSFDWIIIDTGPNMGLFTRSALAASHFALMPVSPGAYSDRGVLLLRRTITTMSALLGTSIDLIGGVVTQWKNDALNQQLIAPVRQSLKIIEPSIPLDKSHIEKAHIETGKGKKKSIFDQKSEAAKAYLTLVDEVQKYVQSRGA